MAKKLKLLGFIVVWFLYGCSPEGTDPLGRTLISHEIPFTNAEITIDGKLDDQAWATAKAVDYQFTWGIEGNKENTQAKLLWDDEYLYVAFDCEDGYIWAEHTERDSPVYRDDCVEVFTSPNPDQIEKYFNIEMNVNAASLDAYHPEGPGSKEEWDPAIQVATSFNGTKNNDDDFDQNWTLEVAIPFSAFEGVAKHIPPKDGDEWRLNLNRLGGKTNNNRSQWSAGDPENPGFHYPYFFGRVFFVK